MGPLWLDSSRNNFQRGAEDVFHFELPDLGEVSGRRCNSSAGMPVDTGSFAGVEVNLRPASLLLLLLLLLLCVQVREVEIGHDNSGLAPSWRCEQVALQDDTTGWRAMFPCDRCGLRGAGLAAGGSWLQGKQSRMISFMQQQLWSLSPASLPELALDT